MKLFISVAVLYSHVSHLNAHFTTGHLLVNGRDTGLWKHVLEVAVFGNPLTNGDYPPGNHFGQVIPQYADDLFTENITCGRAAFNSLVKTEIADVVAGEEIGFRTMSGAEVNSGGSFGYFYHPGPAQVWLSHAPNDDLKSYHGDGDWFKVAYAGPKSNTEWMLWGGNELQTDFNFTLPHTTPPGAYLLRFEYFMPSSSYNYTQWFINCALVNIHSPDLTIQPGIPTGFAQFPGAYEVEDPGLWVPFSQEWGALPKEQMRLLEYKPPGPAVWKG